MVEALALVVTGPSARLWPSGDGMSVKISPAAAKFLKDAARRDDSQWRAEQFASMGQRPQEVLRL